MNIHEKRYNALRRRVDVRVRSLVKRESSKEVNDACRYVLSAGGKRIRAVLVLLSCEAVGGKVRDALAASAAIEIMHNFTLVHDDVMDNAASRRGRSTVHTKWDVNTAILSGDILLGFAYKEILKSRNIPRVLEVFTDGFLTVCEGQALDLDFEHRSNVTLGEYFMMIEKKTGRLIAASAELGACIGGGTETDIASLRKFGHYLGRAFQLQDDLLDVVADEKEFGKTIGGDIVEGKKTFLLLRSLGLTRGKERKDLMRVMNRNVATPRRATRWRATRWRATPRRSHTERAEEIRRITALYRSSGAIAEARRRIASDTRRAVAMLQALPDSRARGSLAWIAHILLKRNY